MCGFLLHLSGGGCVLWVCAHHGLADFETLQHVAGRWAGCYNARLEQWESHLAAIGVDPALPCHGSSRPTPYAELRQQQQQPADGAGRGKALAGRPPAARLCAADVDAHLDPSPPPPGLPPRDEWAVAGPFSGLAVMGKALYHMQLLGGGVEVGTGWTVVWWCVMVLAGCRQHFWGLSQAVAGWWAHVQIRPMACESASCL